MTPTGSQYRWGWLRKTSAVIGIATLSTAALYVMIIAAASMDVESAADAQAIARSATIAIVLVVVGLAAGATWYFLKNRK